MELDPLQAPQQSSPQSPTQISPAQAQAANDFWMGLEPSNTARGEDSEDEEDDANWNPRQTVQRFSQRMQAQGRFLRAQMQENKRQASEPPAPRIHIPAVVEEAQQRPWRVRYYHNDQIGTPRELTSEEGEILWCATYRAWGNTFTEQWLPQRSPAQTARTSSQATRTGGKPLPKPALLGPVLRRGDRATLQPFPLLWWSLPAQYIKSTRTPSCHY